VQIIREYDGQRVLRKEDWKISRLPCAAMSGLFQGQQAMLFANGDGDDLMCTVPHLRIPFSRGGVKVLPRKLAEYAGTEPEKTQERRRKRLRMYAEHSLPYAR